MTLQPHDQVSIVGAGLAGPLLATMLARRGLTVHLYERRSDPRITPPERGRSINMALSARGMHALERAGLKDLVTRDLIPMKGRMIRSAQGTLTFQPYGSRPSEVINSISRAGLNQLLLDQVENSGRVTILFDCEALVDESSPSGISVRNARTAGHSSIPPPIIAADGSGSVVRKALLRQCRGTERMFPLGHGYKELMLPALPNGGFAMEPNALHIWPRGDFMLIALPNPDGTFTCTLFLPVEGPVSFDALGSSEKVARFFQTVAPDAVALIPDLVEQYELNPIGSLGTLECSPWHWKDRILLIGDAAHAIVPFFGQGMNCAFEDCEAVDEEVERHGTDWAMVFAALEGRRRPNAVAIAAMALENYMEMRSDTSDPLFHLRKQVEFELERRFPDRFIPRYSMVSFHTFPYVTARARGEIQSRLLEEILREARSVNEVDWEKAGRLVTSQLSPIGSPA